MTPFEAGALDGMTKAAFSAPQDIGDRDAADKLPTPGDTVVSSPGGIALKRRRRIVKKAKLVRKGATSADREAFNARFPNAGVSLARDKNGVFVYTHRARSPSYPSVDKLPADKVRFVESTG